MSSSKEDSEYEPSHRSLNTSDDTTSLSDNDYFLTSEEEEEGGEGRAWRSLQLLEERMNAAPPCFQDSTRICLEGYFQNKKLTTKMGKTIIPSCFHNQHEKYYIEVK